MREIIHYIDYYRRMDWVCLTWPQRQYWLLLLLLTLDWPTWLDWLFTIGYPFVVFFYLVVWGWSYLCFIRRFLIYTAGDGFIIARQTKRHRRSPFPCCQINGASTVISFLSLASFIVLYFFFLSSSSFPSSSLLFFLIVSIAAEEDECQPIDDECWLSETLNRYQLLFHILSLIRFQLTNWLDWWSIGPTKMANFQYQSQRVDMHMECVSEREKERDGSIRQTRLFDLF